MSAKLNLKITSNGKDFKKINSAPQNFNELINIAIEKLGGNIKDDIEISFVDLATNREITNQKEYDSIKERGQNLKLQILVKEVKNDFSNNYPDVPNIDNINEIAINEQQEQIPQQHQNIQIPLEEDYRNKLKESLSNIITSKIQSMQTEIINELCNEVNNVLSSNMQSQFNQPNKMLLSQNNIIHKGISCSNCKMNDIKGTRYKCTKCANYNLCEVCERMNVHDVQHILIKIRIPINDNELPEMKIKYDSNVHNFDKEQIMTNLSAPIGSEILKTQVKIKNTGTSMWNNMFMFKCLENESGIKGVATQLNEVVSPNGVAMLSITFDTKAKNAGTFNSLWRMYDNNGVPFGSIITFTITIQNN